MEITIFIWTYASTYELRWKFWVCNGMYHRCFTYNEWIYFIWCNSCIYDLCKIIY